MKCINDSCDNVLTGRQRTFCSDKCRMAQSRTDKTHKDGRQGHKSNKPEQSMPKSNSCMIPEQYIPGPIPIKLRAGDLEVQTIFDRRNTQGQTALYGDWPDRTKTETI